MENYNEKIAMLLKKMGISPALLGYKYLAEAIKIVLDNEDTAIEGITKCLYPAVAKKFKTTISRVERGIRFAIEIAFSKMPVDMASAAFGNTISYEKGKATNSEFIATIVELITSEPNNPIWNM